MNEIETPIEAPTAHANSIFVARVRAALAKIQRSARWLERESGLGTGTLSKLASGKGRTVLDGPKIRAIAEAIVIDPVTLVEGTPLCALLNVADLREARLRAAEASSQRLRAEIAEAQKQREQLTMQHKTLSAELAECRAERSKALASVASLRETVAGLNGQLTEVGEQRDRAVDDAQHLVARLERWKIFAKTKEDEVDWLRGLLQQRDSDLQRFRAQIAYHQDLLRSLEGWVPGPSLTAQSPNGAPATPPAPPESPGPPHAPVATPSKNSAPS